MTKVLIWLASGETDKLMPGIIWGTNARKYGWVDDVRFVVFGESERALLDHEALFEMLQTTVEPSYCKYVATSQQVADALQAKGARVEYVGEPIAEMIRDGYQVLVF